MEEVVHGEVGELQGYLTNHTGLSVAKRKLHLVVVLRLQHPVDVYRSVGEVGLHVGNNGFGIEVTHLLYLTGGAHEGILAKKVAGLGHQFAAHNILIQAVVTGNTYTVDGCLRTFKHTHLKVYGVGGDIDLHGLDASKHVSIIII